MKEIKNATEEYINKETVEFLRTPFKFDAGNFGGIKTAREATQVKLLYSPEWNKWLDAMYYTAFTTWDNGHEISLDKISERMTNEERRQMTLEFMKKRPISAALESAVFVIRINNVSRAMTAQICRHRQMSFNEMSMRVTPAHHADLIVSESMNEQQRKAMETIANAGRQAYVDAIMKGLPTEQARNIIPLGTATKITMTTNLKALIDYTKARTLDITQDEHTYIVMRICNELKNNATEFYENFIKNDKLENEMKQYLG